MRSRVLKWVGIGFVAAFAALIGVRAASAPAFAYSAAQAEAQTEPVADPYDFPNIQLCCRPHRPRPPSFCDRFPDSPRCICRRRHGHGCHDHGDHDDVVDVDCGGNPRSRHVFTSLQDAVEEVEPGGTIRVRSAFPGNGCAGNIVITKSLTIQGVTGAFSDDEGDRGYGDRAYGDHEDGDRGPGDRARPSWRGGDDPDRSAGDEWRGDRRPVAAVVDGCVSVWGPGRPRVVLRDIEILGTTGGYWKDCNPAPEVHEGTSGLSAPRLRTGDNLFTALMVDGGTLIGSNLSVRSAGRALFAEHSVVQLNGGNLAAHPAYEAADAAVWLLRSQADLRGVAIAGGRDGVVVSMLDRYPVTFTDVSVLPVRTQVGGVYPEDGRLYRGKTGVRVSVDYENLPSTSYHDLAGFRWTGGTVHGYRRGIDVGPGVGASITGVSIIDVRRGIHIARGAQVAFVANKILGSENVGVQIDPGAQGQAVTNDITCAHGECICYGDDCDNDDADIDAPGFVLHGNQCRSERGRRRSYEDVGGDDE